MNFVLALSRRAWGSSWDRRAVEDMHGGCHSPWTDVWSKQPTEEDRISEEFRVALTEGDSYR
jgi:hypothetical protein